MVVVPLQLLWRLLHSLLMYNSVEALRVWKNILWTEATLRRMMKTVRMIMASDEESNM